MCRVYRTRALSFAAAALGETVACPNICSARQPRRQQHRARGPPSGQPSNVQPVALSQSNAAVQVATSKRPRTVVTVTTSNGNGQSVNKFAIETSKNLVKTSSSIGGPGQLAGSRRTSEARRFVVQPGQYTPPRKVITDIRYSDCDTKRTRRRNGRN